MAAILLASHKSYREKVRQQTLPPEVIEEVVKTPQGEVPFRFTNDEEFKTDMQFIDIVFLTRGAVFDKIKGKNGESMKRLMDLMKAKYNINTRKRKPGTTLDSKTVTIPRIAASFPQVTVGCTCFTGVRKMSSGPICSIPSRRGRSSASAKGPIFSPMMPSLLPLSEDAPLAVMLAISVKVDDLLHQADQKTSLSTLYQYLMTSYNSTAQTELIKQYACSSWGIGVRTNGGFTYSEPIKNLRARAKLVITQSRGNDPQLLPILEQV